jgi:putative peptide zinc metalloprotease protein
MKSKIIIKNPELIIQSFDSSSIENEYVLKIKDKCFKIQEPFLQILLYLSDARELTELQDFLSINHQTKVSLEDTINFVENTLIAHNLVLYKNGNEIQSNHKDEKARKSYIKLQITLFQFETLRGLIKRLTFLFNPFLFCFLNILTIMVSIVVVIDYHKNEIYNINLTGLEYIVIFLIIYAGTMWHEFGHFTACCKFGITPKNIGFGLYIVFPVLFSDVTSIWLLDRKKRMIVNYAGIYFQLIFVTIVYGISLLTSSANNPILLKTTYFTLIGFISTLNPILRFDGYWLMSDALGVDNLRTKTNSIIHYYKNIIFCKNVVKPSVFSQYTFTKLILIQLYTFISFIFLCFFYYIIAKEAVIFFKDIWKYLLDLSSTDYHFVVNAQFLNVLIKFIIFCLIIYTICVRIFKK